MTLHAFILTYDLPLHEPAEMVNIVLPRRATQHLDLFATAAPSHENRGRAEEVLYEAFHNRKKIVVVAGAGISVSTGIPDFRSSDGLFRTLQDGHQLKGSRTQLFDASVYRDDLLTTTFHETVRELSLKATASRPTAFHRLVARLAAEGRLLRLYSQNIDGIETQLPPLTTQVPLPHKPPWPQTVQLHGSLEKMMCQKCQHISTFEPELFKGPSPPRCPECVSLDAIRTGENGKRSHGIGRLRPRIVLYNEHNPDEEAIGAVTTSDLRQRPDAVIVVGTSLKIGAVQRMVRELCGIVRDRDIGTAIWINRDPVPVRKELENAFDLIVRGEADDVAAIVGLDDWDDGARDMVHTQGGFSAGEDSRSSMGLTEIANADPPAEISSRTTSQDPAWPFSTPPIRQLTLPAWH